MLCVQILVAAALGIPALVAVIGMIIAYVLYAIKSHITTTTTTTTMASTTTIPPCLNVCMMEKCFLSLSNYTGELGKLEQELYLISHMKLFSTKYDQNFYQLKINIEYLLKFKKFSQATWHMLQKQPNASYGNETEVARILSQYFPNAAKAYEASLLCRQQTDFNQWPLGKYHDIIVTALRVLTSNVYEKSKNMSQLDAQFMKSVNRASSLTQFVDTFAQSTNQSATCTRNYIVLLLSQKLRGLIYAVGKYKFYLKRQSKLYDILQPRLTTVMEGIKCISGINKNLNMTQIIELAYRTSYVLYKVDN